MSELRQTFVIARRELLERVRTKWFALVTLLGPIGMIAMIVIPVLIASHGTTGSKIEIADATGTLGAKLQKEIETTLGWKAVVVPAATTDDVLRGRIARSEINGFLRIPANALDGGEIDYSGDNASSQAVALGVNTAVNRVVQAERGARMKLTAAQIDAVLQKATFRALHTTGETEGASGAVTFIIGYLLAFVLYFVITLYCVNVMRSVVVEKSSRVMELMCATAKPRVLLGGKILGVGGAGLIQITIWIVMGAAMLAYREQLLGVFGVHGAGGTALPELAASQVAVFVVYFIVGYFFYSSLFAAAGAMVSSEQDIQQVQMPITLVLIIGMVCINIVSNDPRGGAAVAMTNVPLWSPMLMPMRYVLGGATLGEVGVSLAILAASTVLMVAIAARIYRVGVLMYGKRASLAEVVRWIRHA